MRIVNNHFALKCNSFLKQRAIFRAIALQRSFVKTTGMTFLTDGVGYIDVAFTGMVNKFITYIYVNSKTHGGVFIYPKHESKLNNDYERDTYRAFINNMD